MLATFNSGSAATPVSFDSKALAAIWLALVTAAFVAILPFRALSAPSAVHALRAERIFEESKKQWLAQPTNSTAAWHFARACFDWADFAKRDSDRAKIANEGIAACRQLTLEHPTLAAGHYYLAMNLGQLARTKSLGALRIVEEMEDEFKLAQAMEPGFDYGGPDRNLGLLYFEAPGWPTSIGSRSKARTHLTRAVELAPDYPDNSISLMEAMIKWNERKRLKEDLAQLGEVLTKARAKLKGEEWAASWEDWDKRWAQIRKKSGADK